MTTKNINMVTQTGSTYGLYIRT